MLIADLLSAEDLDTRATELAETHRENENTSLEELLPLARHAAQLEALLNATDSRARIDRMTGLLRRETLFDELDRALKIGNRTQSPVGAIMVDLDYFKEVNDRFGHAAGDLVLREVGRAIREFLRDTDIGGRYGGEEFLIVTTGSERPQVFAEKLRKAIAALPFPEFPDLHVTASFGVALVQPASAAFSAELLRGADAALYEAKRNGRNQISLASRAFTTEGVSTTELMRHFSRSDGSRL